MGWFRAEGVEQRRRRGQILAIALAKINDRIHKDLGRRRQRSALAHADAEDKRFAGELLHGNGAETFPRQLRSPGQSAEARCIDGQCWRSLHKASELVTQNTFGLNVTVEYPVDLLPQAKGRFGQERTETSASSRNDTVFASRQRMIWRDTPRQSCRERLPCWRSCREPAD